jgi:protein-S-isoprenylcysteine O-methyltransferase Ste14
MLWIRSAVFATAFVGFFFWLVPRLILDGSGNPHALTGLPLAAGAPVIVAGFALALWCWGVFGALGRGTPAPFDPPRHLVVRGPYRYVRNPMYIGGVMMVLGQAMIFGSAPLLEYAIVVWFTAHLLVVLYEEPALKRSFGEEYSEYRSRVRRWLPGSAFNPSARPVAKTRTGKAS